ncbi:VOC family protein [Chromobacterium violaceum]|uniref:Virulence protein STM3117 n=1 Tax=Chromobacterium violaceum TaxID=536 RepID=A0AAX2MEV5_CHRVL|nr:VOC family protein [Chromobacterium violaceum]OLZ81180.1 VOC family virulence protein [Chromobacterium violaceum]STB70428.1 Virulence protein STM3117 [Chromobacterium violaceum]SUX35079.1 Virulence protein STM3117 [Chromobacterium violaceum]
MISHIDHIVLTVRDIEAAVDFYRRALKLEAVTFGNGRRALRFGNQKINLQTLGQETRNHAAIGSGDLCLIASVPLTAVIEHLKREGVAIVEGPITRSGAMGPITSVYFNDPDGNLVEVSSYSF